MYTVRFQLELSGSENYKSFNYLSLGGACEKIAVKTEADMPIALKDFLDRNSNIQIIVFHLDNDEVGIGATQKIMMIVKRNHQCLIIILRTLKMQMMN